MTARHWITLVDEEHRFLRPVFSALGAQTLRAWVEPEVRIGIGPALLQLAGRWNWWPGTAGAPWS